MDLPAVLIHTHELLTSTFIFGRLQSREQTCGHESAPFSFLMPLILCLILICSPYYFFLLSSIFWPFILISSSFSSSTTFESYHIQLKTTAWILKKRLKKKKTEAFGDGNILCPFLYSVIFGNNSLEVYPEKNLNDGFYLGIWDSFKTYQKEYEQLGKAVSSCE